MANEADVLNHDSDIHYFTVANTANIAKGALIVLSADPRTCTRHSNDALTEIPLGYSVMEKKDADGTTLLPVRTRGVIDAVVDGAVVLGDLLVPGTTINRLQAMARGELSSISYGALKHVAGVALETGSDGEKIAVLLRLG